MLKKISGMATMYLRLNNQRSTILMGSDAMNCKCVTSTMKRMNPILTKNVRNTVAASSGGRANRYNRTSRMPGASRCSTGMPSIGLPSQLRQKISETLTFLSGSTLCGSQKANGPKKFQLGPRRNVPSTISTTHSTTKPNMKVVIANQRFVNEK